MNDTIQILFRKAIVAYATYLVHAGWITTAGATKLEDFAGAAVALAISFFWAKAHVNSATPAPDAPKATLRVPLMLLAVALALSFTGCTTSQQTASYQAASTTDAAVRAAMTGWGVYVATTHPSTNTELRIREYFDVYRDSELAVIDATAALATNSAGNTNAITAALVAEQAAQLDLVNLIADFTNAPAH